LENKRRPKSINLHHRQGGQMRSRQASIPLGKKIDETALFELAKNLLGQIVLEGRVWPCSNISLSVGGFEDGIVGNMGIGAFLVKGDEAKALRSSTRESRMTDSGQERPEKRRRLVALDATAGIEKFFGRTDSIEEHDDEFGAQYLLGNSPSADGGNADGDEFERAAATLPYDNEATKLQKENTLSTGKSALQQQQITDYICSRCNQVLESADALNGHHDWHFAKDLQDEDNRQPSRQPKVAKSKTNKKSRTNMSKKSARDKPEKGQSKLAFG